jgi:N-acetylmuramoyl-L-alanine amidase
MNKLVILLDNGHGNNTPGKRSPKWKDIPQIFE